MEDSWKQQDEVDVCCRINNHRSVCVNMSVLYAEGKPYVHMYSLDVIDRCH
jgi:hypothetical protein